MQARADAPDVHGVLACPLGVVVCLTPQTDRPEKTRSNQSISKFELRAEFRHNQRGRQRGTRRVKSEWAAALFQP